MTFDQYSRCSYSCLYCFSYYQKSHCLGPAGERHLPYQQRPVYTVNVEQVKRLFMCDPSVAKRWQQFWPLIRSRKYMQWGGMADPFDENERKLGVGLELLRFFKKINYPLTFSTKGTWWLYDKRYVDLFTGQTNWHCKFSIITLDADKARRIEIDCPSPEERIDALHAYAQLNAGTAILRLRPYMIGLSNDWPELIRRSAEAGAAAVSTEYFCLETRADPRLQQRYKAINKVLGYDMLDFYRTNSSAKGGYKRLTRQIKLRTLRKMRDLCDNLGLRFYVSDAHGKELSHNGSCCGLAEDCNYCHGQFTQAIVIARRKGYVTFSDIADDLGYAREFMWRNAQGFNTETVATRVRQYNWTMYDYIRACWNNTKNAKSPQLYFGGALESAHLDGDGNVVYRYCGDPLAPV